MIKKSSLILTIVGVLFLGLIITFSSLFFLYNSYFKERFVKVDKLITQKNIDFIDGSNQDKNSIDGLKDVISDSINSQVWLLAKVNNSKSQGVLDKAYFSDDFVGYVVVVTSDGWLLTSNKIDYQAKDLVVINNKNEIIPIEKLIKDSVLGISFIKINKSGLEPIAISDSSELSVGSDVYSIKPNLYNYQNEAIANSIRNLHSRFITNKSDLIHRSNNIVIYGMLKDYQEESLPVVNDRSQFIGFTTNFKNNTYLIGSRYIRNSIKSFFNNNNTVIYPTLNISYIDLSELVLGKDYPDTGAYVYEALKTSPLKKGDIITYVNDEKVNEIKSLSTLLIDYKPDTEVTLTILRSGKELKINTKLGILKTQ